MHIDLSTLNQQQQDAILKSFDKHTVVVAGAGSGKTRTLTYRIGYLIKELEVFPDSIMVVTFTNKAANEIKERLSFIGPKIHQIWLGTFHSICIKIIKQFGVYLDIDKFTIMDPYDQKVTMSEVLKALNLNNEKSMVNNYLEKISHLKNCLINPSTVLNNAKTPDEKLLGTVYQAYQNVTWSRKSFDFDDLIVYSVLLIERFKEVKEWFHKNIKYIMVDEAQDTNIAQFQLIRLLVGSDTNLFIVGDDDQSLYSWRMAKPEYIINFTKLFDNSQILKLEQNYRSTKTIVNASNAVIKNNKFRNDKTMFTANNSGEAIILHEEENNEKEAEWIATEIKLLNTQGIEYKDIAILYRTNAQSRALEEQLMRYEIPYRIFGGINFYDRKEIKDIISYLKLKVNNKDEVSFKRVLGLQKGVGKKTIEEIIKLARENSYTYLDVLSKYNAKPKVAKTFAMLNLLFSTKYNKVSEFVQSILQVTGYLKDLVNENTIESKARIENINEFMSVILDLERKNDNFTIEDLVNQISLMTDKDSENSLNSVNLMTIHTSKGLEFDIVFLAGVEENVLPHENSINIPSLLEEERRLMYVAMTRAKKQLYILYSKARKSFEGFRQNEKSRFINEIPKQYIFQT